MTEPADNKVSMNEFLKQSYNQAKSYIKDGAGRTRDYLHRMTLPVNNFLKDISQIETELHEENSKTTTQFMLMDGQLVPIEQVLSRPMEENY